MPLGNFKFKLLMFHSITYSRLTNSVIWLILHGHAIHMNTLVAGRVDVFMKMARKWHESQKIARKWHETAIGHFIVPKQLVMMSDR